MDYSKCVVAHLDAGLEEDRPLAPQPLPLQFRPLHPSDFQPLKLLHQQLLPIDYDDTFFHKAVAGLDEIASVAAVAPLRTLPSLKAFSPTAAAAAMAGRSYAGRWGLAPGPAAAGAHLGAGRPAYAPQHPHPQLLHPGGAAVIAEQLVGFITAKPFPLCQVELRDRELMGFADPNLDEERVSYILTLGVAEGFRGQGVATDLVAAMAQQAAAAGCCALYLHVLSLNASAIAFYRRLGFHDVALLPDFYVIRTGRQPDPGRQIYDAVLFVSPLQPPLCCALAPHPCSPPSALPPLAHSASTNDAEAAAAAAADANGAGPTEVAAPVAGLLPGGTMLRAVSHLASCMPLAAGCSPQRHRKKRAEDEEGGGEGGGRWHPNSSSLISGGYCAEERAVLHHRRAGAAETGGSGGGEAGGQGGRPPWLKGLFARAR